MHKLVVREPVDFIAIAPLVVGFQPQRSVVMICLGSFAARVDIPSEGRHDELIEVLLRPALRHKVKAVAFLVYDDVAHDDLLAELVGHFLTKSIDVVEALNVRNDIFRSLHEEDWHDYDLESHPFTLEAIFNDQATHRTRQELENYVRPVGAERSDEHAQAIESLHSGVASVIVHATREDATEQRELWVGALRSCQPEDELVGKVAAVAAFYAWLSGDGAAAWCALDHATEAPASQLVADLLSQAVSPSAWDGWQAEFNDPDASM